MTSRRMSCLEFGTSQGVPIVNEIFEEDKNREKPVKLFLGSAAAALNKDLITQNQIQAVLTIDPDSNLRYPKEIIKEHKIIKAEDNPQTNIQQFFQESIEFIERNFNEGRNILVHCMAGVSRSPTIVIAYLIHNNNWSFQRAFNLVKEKRAVCNPNIEFIRQLKQFDETLRSKQK